jgi:hypothetical protein
MVGGLRSDTVREMSSDSHLPTSDDADPEDETTPGGAVRDLEEMAEETGAAAPEDEPAAQ